MLKAINYFQTCQNLLKSWFTLSHFALGDPVEYILQDFLFGIGIWLWAVENLGSNHHVSVVHGIFDLSKITYANPFFFHKGLIVGQKCGLYGCNRQGIAEKTVSKQVFS